MRAMSESRKVHALAIARAIHASDDLSRQSVASAVGISVPTSSVTCNDMIERKTVVEVEQRKGSRGRPPITLALDPRQGIFVSVEISPHVVKAKTFDSALSPLTESEIDIEPQNRSPDRIATLVREVVAQENLKSHSGDLLGVSVAGPSEVHTTAAFPGSTKDPLREAVMGLLHHATDSPLLYCSPSHALVAAEIWSFPERSKQDFVVVDLGIEVGVGIVLGGRQHRGHSNTAGAWGHSVLVADGRACRCGARGCVESYVGALGIIQTLRESHASSPLARSDDPESALGAIHDAANVGDSDAMDVYRQAGGHLGLALGSLLNILNPQAVVIAGLVASALGDLLLKTSMPHVHQQALVAPLMAVDFDFRTSDQSRVALGLAALMLERHLETRFSKPYEPRGSDRRTPPRAGREHIRPGIRR